MAEEWKETLNNMNKNCISRLQEYAAKRGLDVRYEELAPEKGGFGYEVYFVKLIASGTGCRKKEAKEATADLAIRTIKSMAQGQSLISHFTPQTSVTLTDSYVCNDNRALPPHPSIRQSIPESETRSLSYNVSVVPDGKNPVSEFMEYAQANGQVGRFEENTKNGPDHRPTFTVCAYLGTRKLGEGTGGNKKAAKRQAAEQSLRLLTSGSSKKRLTSQVLPSRTPTDKNAGICPAGADPISILNEFAQKAGLELTFPNPDVRGADHQRQFTLGAMIGGTRYTKATASTIREAKREASRQALKQLKQAKLYRFSPESPKFCINEPLTFHDKIAKLCHEKFDTVVADIPENLAGRKVIAGVVMESKTTGICDVISLASGNRFIRGNKLTTDGLVLVDSHAEVLANRGMRRFLYHHLTKLWKGEETKVFQKCKNGKVKVSPGIQFHLYISTAPCGDGAIFTHSDGSFAADPDGKHRPTFDNTKQGLLRNKIELGEGQIPRQEVHGVVGYQGLDEVRRGERLRVMSCSDKICKWNLLGIHGALLANLMEPAYYTSITLGTLFNHGHMTRAMCCRLERKSQIKKLQFGYKVNHPLLGNVSHTTGQRSVEKSTAYSINWNRADDCYEMTDGTTGQLQSSGLPSNIVYRRKVGSTSRLCKKMLLNSYKELCTYAGVSNLVKDDYLSTKTASSQYQTYKTILYEVMERHGYGGWLGLPRECQEFNITHSNEGKT